MEPHPYGVEPLGNRLISNGPSPKNCRSSGLGSVSILSDELVLGVLEHMEAADLARLAMVSRACFAFAFHDELWRAIVLTQMEGTWKFHQNWRGTYLKTKGLLGSRDVNPRSGEKSHAKRLRRGHQDAKRKCSTDAGGEDCKSFEAWVSPVCLKRSFFSDVLFQPWFCANVPLDPTWLEVENIDRRSNLSVEEFRRNYEIPNKPVVVTDCATHWPAINKWTRQYLLDAYQDGPAIVGGCGMHLEDYYRYADQAATDDQPLYLFDKLFSTTAPALAKDYTVPDYFQEDLFSVLGEESRPDYRWLIVGPKRSGSSFHKDPNATSAWNVTITGSKRWVMFPPSVVPPGVHPSADGSSVAAPVSLVEWYLNFYEEAVQGEVKPLECTTRKGDLVFVPRGWWHMVLNLEETVAVTQNYVSSINLRAVMRFLESQNPELVSGLCSHDDRATLYKRFKAALAAKHPHLIHQLEQSTEAARVAARKNASLASLFSEGRNSTVVGQISARGRDNASNSHDETSSNTTITQSIDGGGFKFNFL